MILISVLPSISLFDGAVGATITVDDDPGEDYQGIQEAVDHASAGDTVMIYGGVYEGGVMVNKSIDIVGDSRENTVIRYAGDDYGLRVCSDSVNIDNLTIKDFQIGIWSCGDWINTSRCSFVDNQRGIFLDEVGHASINESSIKNGTEGIYSMDSDEISLENITAEGQSERGFRFVNCSSSTVRKCRTEDSDYHPLYISRSTDMSVKRCSFNSTERGAYLYHSKNMSSSNNHFENGLNIDGGELSDWNSHSFDNDTVGGGDLTYLEDRRGVGLQGIEGQVIAVNISDSVIFGSDLSDVEAGLLVVDSSGNDISGNTLSSNFEGMKMFRSENNEIHHNNFENNTRTLNSPDGSSQANIWNDGMGDGNYWDDYEGLDNGSGGRYVGDGVGDTDLSHPVEDHGCGYYSLDPNPLMNRTEAVNRSIYLNISESGWHFISTGIVTPYEDHHRLLDSIEEDYDRLMYYSAEDDTWFSYSDDRADHYNDMPALNRSMGFWIHLENSTYLNISGFSCARTKMKIFPGWNSVGISSSSIVSNESLPSFVDKVGVYNASMEYDIEYREEGKSTFDPDMGYWIHSDHNSGKFWNMIWEE